VESNFNANRCSELPEDQLKLVNNLLFNTYPSYKDRTSRLEVQKCLLAVWKSSPQCLTDFVKQLKVEATKLGLAPSNILVLIEWASLVLQTIARDEENWAQHGIETVTVDAQLLELLSSLKPRHGMSSAAVTVTRRALRKLFKPGKIGSEALEKSILQLTGKSSLGYKPAVLLGIIAGVSSRLKISPKLGDNGALHPKETLESYKNHFYTFWVREVIGSKTKVPAHITTAFHDFFTDFATIDDLNKEIVPALEKALLRAPEVVLNDIITPMISPLPKDLDLSEILAKRLLKPLLSNLKSTNVEIRNGAVKAISILLQRSKEDDSLEIVMNEILKPLITSKVPSADQRALHAQILGVIPYSQSRSSQICNGVAGMALKEPNETAMVAEARSLAHHLAFLILETSEKIELPLSTIAKGLNDKKPSVQRVWALRAGQLLWALKSSLQVPSAIGLVSENIVPKLLDVFTEIVNNPFPAAQSGQIVVAYIVTSLTDFWLSSCESSKVKDLLQKAKVFQQAMIFDPKPSFLLHPKVYTKITDEENLTWLIRALAASSSKATAPAVEPHAALGWAQVWLFIITAAQMGFKIQRQAIKALSQLYLKSPDRISETIINGLWAWNTDLLLDTKESAAVTSQTGMEKLHLVVEAITFSGNRSPEKSNPISKEILQGEMKNLLVLLGPGVIPKTSWIETCIELGQDPGALVSSNPEGFIEKVNSILYDSKQALDAVKVACHRTFAELAFVAPQAILPLLVNQIKGDLSLAELEKFTPTDFAIARTAEGTTFVDILNAKRQAQTLDKGSSDYEIQKWEAEVRAQQAAKKGQQKKLTPDEQAKVQAQLAKESEIRGRVRILEGKVQRGIGTIKALALGPPTEFELWMGPSLKALIDSIQAGVGSLVGESASDAFVACANLVTPRLGALRQFIGVATLRSLGSPHLPEYLLQESLGVLVTRVLYRLRILGEQRPFDAVSLSYMLPLMHIVLRCNGIGFKNQDEADEQVTLAIEFLSFHSDICKY
jgi:hypothetical protein